MRRGVFLPSRKHLQKNSEQRRRNLRESLGRGGLPTATAHVVFLSIAFFSINRKIHDIYSVVHSNVLQLILF